MTVVCLSDEDLRGLHQVQLTMLLELDRVCRRLGVAYQLGAGSLLGAVRHGGFLPWDDDIDVVMAREDYQRFLREAPLLLDTRFVLQTWRSDPGFQGLFAKLRRQDSVFREEFHQHTRQHHGIYIDIFPFDPVWPESWWWRLLLAVVLRIHKFVGQLQKLAGDGNVDPLRGGQPAWKRRLRALVHPGLDALPASLWMAIQEGLMRSLALVPSGQVVCLVSGSLHWERLQSLARPAAEFEQTVRLSFEGWSFPVTAAYHQALTRLYGDYRRLPPPERQMPGHPVVEFRLPVEGRDSMNRRPDRPATASAAAED